MVGAAFSLEVNETSDLIEGSNGLYKIKLIGKVVADELASYTAYSNSLRIAENSRISTAVFEALKSSSEIEDNRSLYY